MLEISKKAKRETGFWTFVVVVMLCLAGLFYASGTFAKEKTVTLHCKARDVKIVTTSDNYMFSYVDFEKGSFRLLPSDSETDLMFYNLDTEKVSTLSGRGKSIIYLAVYKSVADYQAKKPEYQDNCHF